MGWPSYFESISEKFQESFSKQMAQSHRRQHDISEEDIARVVESTMKSIFDTRIVGIFAVGKR